MYLTPNSLNYGRFVFLGKQSEIFNRAVSWNKYFVAVEPLIKTLFKPIKLKHCDHRCISRIYIPLIGHSHWVTTSNKAFEAFCAAGRGASNRASPGC